MFTGYTATAKLFWVTTVNFYSFVIFIHEWLTRKWILGFLINLFHLLLLNSNQPPEKLSHFFCRCPRFWRRKVHLIWGPPVASAMLHLLPVLRLAGGRRLFPYRWQDLVPWMQQQPLHAIEKLLPMYSPLPWRNVCYSSREWRSPDHCWGRNLRLTNAAAQRSYYDGSVCCRLHQISHRNCCHVQRWNVLHLILSV